MATTDPEPEALRGTEEPMRIHRVGMTSRKRIALIAHDNRKDDMLEWARFNRGSLSRHELFATGTTGGLIASELGLPVTRFLSGPLGGDQQVGAMIAEGRIDALIFFVDPLSPHPHDVDVKALMRLALVYDIPMALNRATAERLVHTLEPLPEGESICVARQAGCDG
jgi:methylglyoxal synthase